MIYAVIAMVALCAFVSLAVDLGRVQLAKTELMRAADSAARAASVELGKGSSLATIQNAAVAMGAANNCDGSSIYIDSTNDIEFGTWNTTTKVFTVVPSASYTSANAARLTVRRTAARSNAIALSFGRILGLTSCDVTASAIAYVVQSPPAITALSNFSAHQQIFIASYNPIATPTPSQAAGQYRTNGQLGANGSIDLGNSSHLWGDEYKGPSATATSKGVIHGSTVNLSSNIPTPDPHAGDARVHAHLQSRRRFGDPYRLRNRHLGWGNILFHVPHDGGRRRDHLLRARHRLHERQRLIA